MAHTPSILTLSPPTARFDINIIQDTYLNFAVQADNSVFFFYVATTTDHLNHELQLRGVPQIP